MNPRINSLLIAAVLSLSAVSAYADTELLNVSYDPTRELYRQYNLVFAKHWKEQTGENISIKQSHGGSGKQAQAILDGLDADVATLALGYDIDQLSEKNKLLPENWQTLLPNNSSPYTSTIVFLVRNGNSKAIKDWNDLIKDGVSIVTPNPKTSGGARWNHLAAWAYALKHNNNDEAAAKNFIAKLYKNTAVLDAGARGATTSFVERKIGDVLIAWENEAHLIQQEFGADKYEIVNPSLSILAEPPVAVIEEVARKHDTIKAATEYLNYLYSKEAQEIVAKNFYRPIDKDIAAKYAKQFPDIELVKISDFGGWDKAQEKHFADGGVFDQIYGH